MPVHQQRRLRRGRDVVYLRNITGETFTAAPRQRRGRPADQNVVVENVTMRQITVRDSTFTNAAQNRPRVSNADAVTFTNVRVNGEPV